MILIVRYLNGALDQRLLYCSIDDIAGFSDADWAGGHNDQNSTSRHVFRMSFAAASWKCKKQRCVASPAAEAEYIALAN